MDVVTKSYVDLKVLTLGLTLLGVQGMLEADYNPLDLIAIGVSKDSLYGKMYQGGLIFYLDDLDTLPGIQGLIVAATDQSDGAAWGCHMMDLPGVPNVAYPPTGLGAEIGDGQSNTSAILSVGNCPTSPAALACTNYTGGGYTDWFFPSAKELEQMENTVGPPVRRRLIRILQI